MWFSRLFVRLLVLGMLPLVLLAGTGAAEAAPVYGDAAEGSFATTDGLGDLTVSCSVVAYFAGSADFPATVHGDLACSTAFNVSSAVVGFTLDGGSCDYAFAPEQVDGAGKLSFVLASGPGYDVAGCVVTQLCWTVERTAHSGPWITDDHSGCVPFALGAPPSEVQVQGSCDFITGARVEVGANYRAENGNSMPAMWRDYRFYGSETGATSTWYVYAVYGAPYSSWWASLNPYSLVANSHAAGTARSGPSLATGAQMSIQESDQGGYSSVTGPPIGVGMYRLNSHPYGPPNTSGDHAWKHVPQDPWQFNTGVAGLSQPSWCSFYWGTKIAERPNDTFDNPLGPIVTDTSAPGGSSEPPVTDDPAPAAEADCGFSVTDPSTWAGAGICQLVKFIKRLLSLFRQLLDFVAAFWGKLGEALRALFVPTVPIGDRLDGMRATFDDRAPFSWLREIASVSTSIPQGETTGALSVTSAREVPGSATPEFQAASQVPADGCPSWNIEVAGWNQNVICGSSYTQAIRDLRPVIFGMMALLALWPLVRGTYYASIPVLSVKPSDPVA